MWGLRSGCGVAHALGQAPSAQEASLGLATINFWTRQLCWVSQEDSYCACGNLLPWQPA